MAKKITFRFTEEAERFLKYMEEQGLNAQDVVARALWLFETAWKTRRVALLDDKFQIEYIYTSLPLADTDEQSIKLHEKEVARTVVEKSAVARAVVEKSAVARAEIDKSFDDLEKIHLNLKKQMEQNGLKEKQNDVSSAERESKREE